MPGVKYPKNVALFKLIIHEFKKSDQTVWFCLLSQIGITIDVVLQQQHNSIWLRHAWCKYKHWQRLPGHIQHHAQAGGSDWSTLWMSAASASSVCLLYGEISKIQNSKCWACSNAHPLRSSGLTGAGGWRAALGCLILLHFLQWCHQIPAAVGF